MCIKTKAVKLWKDFHKNKSSETMERFLQVLFTSNPASLDDNEDCETL